jgi:hypothetical protein
MSDLPAMRRTGWLLRLLPIVLTTTAYSTPSAIADPTAGDAAATHAYLEARLSLQRASTAAEPAELEALATLEAQVKAECPGVLAGAPPHVKGEKTNESTLEIDGELLSATFGDAEHVQHPAEARFASAVHRLRWSNPTLTRLLRSLAREAAAQSAIPTPDLCSDMKFWVASGYTTVSAGTKQFLQRLNVVSSITTIVPEPHEPVTDTFDLNALVAHRLKPYEDRADVLLAKKALPPESTLNKTTLDNPTVRAFLEAAGKVLAALGRTSTSAT